MTIYYNGHIHTMDPAVTQADCMLVADDGRIRYVGKLNDLGIVPMGLNRVDLSGAIVIPGFNDAHVHIWKLGLLLTVQVDARGAAAPTMPAIVERFHERAASVSAGTWLTGRGYNEADLPERRHPTAADLDAASAEHPIALTRTCGHMIVANTLALRLAGITSQTPDPPGGVIVRDEHGQPTGLLQETAMGLIARAIPEPDDTVMGEAIIAAMAHQLTLGITSATDPLLTPSHLRVYHQLEANNLLAVRVNGLPIRRPDGGTETLPLPQKYVSDTLRIDCVKFFADGGLSGATAAISQPYKVTGTRGLLRFEAEELFELMFEAHVNGYRIGTHAIGDVALEQVISTYEKLYRKHSSVLRHRIEHLGLPDVGHLKRCAAMKVIAVPQTVFLPALGNTYRRYLPDEFFPRCYPVASMLDAGLTVALSSDAPVVPDDNPLLGMKAAMDRLDPNGEPIASHEAIRAYEALYAYTMGGAIASGDRENRGSISVGKWADFAVLSGDPLAAPAADMLNIRVQQTYVGGQRVYEA
jgi:predicted amidohydrolase YtcJ